MVNLLVARREELRAGPERRLQLQRRSCDVEQRNVYSDVAMPDCTLIQPSVSSTSGPPPSVTGSDSTGRCGFTTRTAHAPWPPLGVTPSRQASLAPPAGPPPPGPSTRAYHLHCRKGKKDSINPADAVSRSAEEEGDQKEQEGAAADAHRCPTAAPPFEAEPKCPKKLPPPGAPTRSPIRCPTRSPARCQPVATLPPPPPPHPDEEREPHQARREELEPAAASAPGCRRSPPATRPWLLLTSASAKC